MTRLFQDVETFSELDLTKVGVSRYARHPSTEIVMLAYAFDDGPIKQFDALTAIGPRGEHSSNYYRSAWMDAAPADWREAMDDPRVDKSGWNVGQFERVVFNHVLGLSIPPDEWRDTMVLALTCSFPGKLDHALKAAGFPAEDQKLASGKALMRYFSQPRKPTKTMARTRNLPADAPDKWLAYLEYNRHDVHAERAFYQRFRDFDLPYWEWELWQLDQKINDRGIPVNLDMVDNAIELAARITQDRMKTMREITGLDNPNSGDQLLPWLRAGGYPFVDLKKGHIARAIDERLVGDDLTLEVLELRRETAKTSVKKFDALALATDDDGYLRYTLQFAAAGRTWRWGGRKFQPQNLARPHKLLAKRMVEIARDIEVMGWEEFDRKYVDPKTKQALSMDALSTGVRPAVQAPDGYVFVEADLKAIENIGLGWMFKDRKILSVFENNRDPYIDFATYMYNLPYDELWAEYKGGDWHKRQICKPGVLGCLGAATLVLTDCGWKRLDCVSLSDLVHDGETFVRHEGLVARGDRACVTLSGVVMTSDHKVMVGENRWVDAGRLSSRSFEKAIGVATLKLSRTSGFSLRKGKFTSAAAVVGARLSSAGAEFPATTANAWSSSVSIAPAGTRVFSELLRAASCLIGSLIDSTRCGDVVRTPTTTPGRTMAAVESSADFRPPIVSLGTSFEHWARTGLLRLIERTTTVTMSPATSDWRTARSIRAILASVRRLFTEVVFTPRRNFIGCLRQRIGTPGRFFGNGKRGSMLGRLFETKPNAEALTPVYDIANAGPNHRFVILSEGGPLIVHNCGYGLSEGDEYEDHQTGEIEATGLLGYAWNMGIREFTKEDSSHSVKTWRRTFKTAVNGWYELHGAMFECVATGRPQGHGPIGFRMKGEFLLMELPSGRDLKYHRPLIKRTQMPWGAWRDSITYMSLDDRNQWVRISTHPGKVTENGDQAICRDILAKGIVRAEKEGIPVRLHVHDSILGLAKERDADRQLKLLVECMTAPISWARGFPIRAEGHATKLFVKD